MRHERLAPERSEGQFMLRLAVRRHFARSIRLNARAGSRSWLPNSRKLTLRRRRGLLALLIEIVGGPRLPGDLLVLLVLSVGLDTKNRDHQEPSGRDNESFLHRYLS